MYAIRSYYAQRAQDAPGHPRMLGHRLQGAEVLAHRALAEDLAGEEEVEPPLRHDLAGDAKHHGVAVDAGIHVLAVTVDGVLDHLQMDVTDLV